MNKILLSPTKYFGHFRFSTSKVLEDWEYVSYIHKKLKENNINEAMSYLINVHITNISRVISMDLFLTDKLFVI